MEQPPTAPAPHRHAVVASEPAPGSDREAQAKAEIGQTTITRGQQWFLCGMFLCVILSAGVVQHVRAIRTGQAPASYEIAHAPRQAARTYRAHNGDWSDKVFAANAEMLRSIKAYESSLEDSDLVSKAVLPQAQSVLLWLGAGNEKAYVGRDGWLFYRPDIDHLTGPAFLDPRQLQRRVNAGGTGEAQQQPDPVRAILHFNEQLRSRGIKLVIVPTPLKPQVHPERFAGRDSTTLLKNASYDEFVRAVESAGVSVFDAGELLIRRKIATGVPQYLDTDTHWTPDAMQHVAQALARHLQQTGAIDASSEAALVSEAVSVDGVGDIAELLQLPEDQTRYLAQRVTLRQVLTPGKEMWRPTRDADVLLLGDSFTNIFSLAPMGWGQSAGFAEQLAMEMRRPVDMLARNDAGAYATRQMLAGELAKGRDRLAGKKVVVWQFATRELSSGDWKLIDLRLRDAAPSQFITPATGETMTVAGTVGAISNVPKPGSVAYKDHIVSVHLVDVSRDGNPIAGGQSVVYLRSMSNNVWTAAARLRAGDTVTVKLTSWSDVARQYDRINRSELDDADLMLQEPAWGELLP